MSTDKKDKPSPASAEDDKKTAGDTIFFLLGLMRISCSDDSGRSVYRHGCHCLDGCLFECCPCHCTTVHQCGSTDQCLPACRCLLGQGAFFVTRSLSFLFRCTCLCHMI